MYATEPTASSTILWSPANIAALPAPSAAPELVQPAQPPPATVVTMAAGTHGDGDGDMLRLAKTLADAEGEAGDKLGEALALGEREADGEVAMERVRLCVRLGVAEAVLVRVLLTVAVKLWLLEPLLLPLAVMDCERLMLALFERERVGDEDAVADRDGVRGPSITTRPHDADDATPGTQNGDDIPVLLPGSDNGALSPNALTRFDIRDEPPPPHCVPPPPP